MRVYGFLAESGAGLHPETLKIRLLLCAGGHLESRGKLSFQPKVQSGEAGPRKRNWTWYNGANQRRAEQTRVSWQYPVRLSCWCIITSDSPLVMRKPAVKVL